MLEIFDLTYDKSVYATRDEMAKISKVSSATMTKVIKDSAVKPVGSVRTGKVGKPSELFKLAELELAFQIYQEKLLLRKQAAKATKALKNGVNPSNDNSDLEEVSESKTNLG